MPRLDGLSLLLVDDDPAIRELMRAALELMGARVTPASSGAEGLASWAAEEPNAVLSDIAMPEMDGYEFIRYMAKPTDPAELAMVMVIDDLCQDGLPRQPPGLDQTTSGRMT